MVRELKKLLEPFNISVTGYRHTKMPARASQSQQPKTSFNDVLSAASASPVPQTIASELGVAAALEARRLAEKYGTDFLNCDQLMEVTELGRGNIRQLLCSDSFPFIQVGNRKVISVIAFALWSLKVGQQD